MLALMCRGGRPQRVSLSLFGPHSGSGGRQAVLAYRCLVYYSMPVHYNAIALELKTFAA